jgi:hypothetical protein
MTWATCLAFCDSGNYPLAGIEYSSQCYCGTTLQNGASLTNTATASMYCSGNSLQLCGGPNVLTLFVSTKSNAQGLSSDYKTMTQSVPTGWAAASTPCVAEGTTGRALTGSWEKCTAYCASGNFPIAAIEVSRVKFLHPP